MVSARGISMGSCSCVPVCQDPGHCVLSIMCPTSNMQQVLLLYILVPTDFHLSFHCQRLLYALRPLHPFIFNSCDKARCILTHSVLLFLSRSHSIIPTHMTIRSSKPSVPMRGGSMSHEELSTELAVSATRDIMCFLYRLNSMSPNSRLRPTCAVHDRESDRPPLGVMNVLQWCEEMKVYRTLSTLEVNILKLTTERVLPFAGQSVCLSLA